MNIFVCLKQVPARDSLLRVNSSASWIDDEDLTLEMNEPDSYALEEGLRLKEKHGGEVIAISAGEQDELPRARRLGASHTFAKPFDTEELLETIEEELGKAV